MKECPSCRHCFLDEFNNCPTDGDLLTFSIVGDTLLDGRYRIERRLGQGGMGIVFKARHIFLKTSYAIKVILPDLVGNDPMLVTRFRQEAMVAARIGHRNIVNVTDFGVVGGKMPYLVMDLIKGKSLHDLLAEEGHLLPQPALEIMAALCAGVGAAHRQGIIHRDLKPLNIMLQDGVPWSEGVKVLDFGLAKIKSGELLGSFVAAQTTGLMGSPYYMAPELWSDDEPDARADIYSLGVILFQMLAGDVPFKGPSLPSIMKKHLTDLPPRFHERGVSVPEDIELVVRHALAKKRDERMSSVEEFINEFRRGVAASNAATERSSMEQTKAFGVADVSYHEGANEATVGPGSFGQASWEGQTLTESQRRIEDEADRLTREFEEAQRRADEARSRAEEASRKRAEEEAARRRAEEEAARKLAEEEAARQHAEAMARKRAEEEAARQQAEEEEARRVAAEEARQRAEEEEARQRAAEEAARLAREIVQAQKRAEEARLHAEEEARKRTEEQVARKRAEEEAYRLALEVADAQRRAEEARTRAEIEAEKRTEAEQKRSQAEAEQERIRAEESIKIHAEGEVERKRAAENADRLAREVSVAQQRAEEARKRAEEEASKRAEAEGALKRAEEEARKLSLQMAEVQRRAEESRRRSEEEARERAEAEAKQRREEQARREREAQVAYAAQAEGMISEVPPTSFRPAPQQQSGFPQSIGAHSASVSEETIVHGSRPPAHHEASWPQSGAALGASLPAVESKSKFTLPIILGVAVFMVILLAGAVVLISRRWQASPPAEQPAKVPPANPVAEGLPKLEMVKIEGGTFPMGRSDVASKSQYDLSQYPSRPVDVKTFLMDKTEVTNAEYANFVSETKYSPPKYWINGKPPSGQEQWPVTNVSVSDAKAFADWRGKRDGVKYRLPTEEEWEYAARNGSEATLYPWGNQWLDDHGNVDANSIKPVGSYPKGASRAGVLDLIGNVWELTSTAAAPYPGNTTLGVPRGQVIIRGGAYVEPTQGPEAISATRRSWLPPTAKEAAVGFRLVRDGP
jgi:serine/threonine protein kinase/formylglycine-generating enzyme required for sulfatase activity